jgi:hypothetical protein
VEAAPGRRRPAGLASSSSSSNLVPPDYMEEGQHQLALYILYILVSSKLYFSAISAEEFQRLEKSLTDFLLNPVLAKYIL